MGALDHLSGLCSFTETREAFRVKKRRPLQVRFLESSSVHVLSLSSRSVHPKNMHANFLSYQRFGTSFCHFAELLDKLLLECFKSFQTVNIKVKMDCEGCERRVKNAVKSIHGVMSVTVSRKINKVTVTGYVEPRKVLARVKSTGKAAEMWPYVPYSVTTYPYVGGTYDKKAPAGMVRSAPQAMGDPAAPEVQYMNMFNDENVDAACIVM
uniref:Uncharacterized protein n=1 Tax=Avena sativa TaxID=4498 RepID=A0ACD5XVH8_AVESA